MCRFFIYTEGMKEKNLKQSIDFLAEEFGHLDFTFHHFREDGHDYIKNLWPGGENEDIMVCVYRGSTIHEPFHRHDFIYFNYAYHNDYAALSDLEANLITIHQGECYIGQPFSGYALRSIEHVESTIVGVLIRREVFFRRFLQTFSSDNTLFHFFIDPETEKYSDKYLHFSFRNVPEVRPLLEMMIMEYASRKEDTQQVLMSMANTLYLLVARTYHTDSNLVTNTKTDRPDDTPVNQILAYMDDHFQTVSLNELSKQFSYHPNYISSLLHHETGKTFSEILLEKRMEHAVVLMKGTSLSNEEIAEAVGYTSTTNYYKSFKRYFHMTPGEYLLQHPLHQEETEYPLSHSHSN